MKIHLIAVGQKMPDWVKKGCQEYLKRMPEVCRVNLIEIEPFKRYNGVFMLNRQNVKKQSVFYRPFLKILK